MAHEQSGFLDRWPWFRETSTTGVQPNRLNSRHRVLIEGNRDVIEGCRILDIGSHDGRWSYAALQAGALHVTGVEGRQTLVERARANMRRGAVPDSAYRFIAGDMHAELPKLPPGAFDTVFCFGVLYHTIHHLPLLRAIARLAPRAVLIDTAVSRGDLPVILLWEDRAADEGNAIREGGGTDERPLVGYPTRSALDLLLRKAGFEYTHVDWTEDAVPSWDGLVDYRDGGRLTLRAAPITPEAELNRTQGAAS